jgi:polyisoprenoid-binding protein YceI
VTSPQTDPAPGTYVLDARASRFTVRAFASGMLASMGHNPTIAIRDFSGEAAFDPAEPEKGRLNIRIRANSLEVTDDIKSSDLREIESLMNQKVLESTKYPTIGFQSTVRSANALGGGRYQVAMDGTLTLHGASGRVPLNAQVTLIGDTLRASGEFSLLQSNFGIAPVSVAGGALKLKDELKFSFDIVAQKPR